jgi:2-polyprenyl-3-methyl-5-hydroxy-6-metoxy-1,4-benzoquinol methylase
VRRTAIAICQGSGRVGQPPDFPGKPPMRIEDERAELLEDAFADKLRRLQMRRWKRVLDVQAPSRWNLRRLKPGRMLDIGCGIGRSLAGYKNGIGVDPNEGCVRIARERGLVAYTPAEFKEPPESFDSLLVAHVLEHLTPDLADDIFRTYLPYLKRGGQVIMMTPQERCFSLEPTHIWWVDFKVLAALAEKWGLIPERSFSFPFPRFCGTIFPYNEFVLTARKP